MVCVFTDVHLRNNFRCKATNRASEKLNATIEGLNEAQEDMEPMLHALFFETYM